MKEYSQKQKCISVVMIFILLTYLSGCSTSRIISKSDLPLTDSSKYSKYTYIIHSDKSKFLLEKGSTISNGILSGKINKIYNDEQYDTGKRIHLYTSSNSVIKIDMGSILSVPLDEITKIELVKVELPETILLIGISIIVVIWVVNIIIFANTPGGFFDWTKI